MTKTLLWECYIKTYDQLCFVYFLLIHLSAAVCHFITILLIDWLIEIQSNICSPSAKLQRPKHLKILTTSWLGCKYLWNTIKWKMALQTAITRARTLLIWQTFVYKQWKMRLEFWPNHQVPVTVAWSHILDFVWFASVFSEDGLLCLVENLLIVPLDISLCARTATAKGEHGRDSFCGRRIKSRQGCVVSWHAADGIVLWRHEEKYEGSLKFSVSWVFAWMISEVIQCL